MSPSTCYEDASLRAAAGQVLRPGGTALTDHALAACRFPPGARLLDVGCGAGVTVEHLEGLGFQSFGVEPSPVLLEAGLKRNPRLPVREGRAEHLPFADGSLDGILCECVLSLLDDPAAALGEFRRVLVPGGFLILGDLYERTSGAGPESLETLLESQAFHLVLWEDHTHLLHQMAARLVLAGCPLDGLCGAVRVRPGYYLAVGRLDTLIGGSDAR